MAYVTTEQLSQRLGATLYARLTDRVNGTTANAAVAQQIIAEAEAEANSYLARRFQTPIDLTAHPELADVLRLRVLDLAEYAAWKSSPFVSDPPERVEAVYTSAVRWFADLADGRVNLPASSLPAPQVLESATARYTATPRAFTAEELKGL
jgi:phage gp36-like protein